MTATHTAFQTFNRWLIFIGLILFGAFVLYRQGLFEALLTHDQSHVSLGILALFLFSSLRAGHQGYRLGRETAAVKILQAQARQPEPLFSGPADQMLVGGQPAETSVAHEHLAFLAEKAAIHKDLRGQDLLLERLDQRLRRGHESGWFIADLLVRLGLLGTVIGFILMLGSITSVESVDLKALQQLLSNMSGGMRIALYTTLTGLGCGILLSFQHQLLDQGADRLLADIIELSEVHATGQLARLMRASDEVA